MSSIKYDISLLDRNTRFPLWQVKMRDILIQMDLHKALLGFEKMPASWDEEEKEMKDLKALSQIRLHLSNDVLQDVLKEKTAAALWLKLEQLLMTKSLPNKLHLKQRLFNLKMIEGGSLAEHISTFKELVNNLENMDVKYEDEDLALFLLSSLPEAYSNFRDTIIYSRDTLVLDEVFTALDSKEKMKHITGSRDASAEGLQARGYKASDRGRYPQPSSEANSKSEGRRKFCNYCKKKGHEIEDCFKLRNKIAEKDKLDGHNQASASGESDVAEVGFVGELL